MKSLSGAFAVLVLLGGADQAIAARWDNPKKNDKYDVVIPVPGAKGEHWDMVLRRVEIPGSTFWVNNERFANFGESSESSVFEKPVSVRLQGSTQVDGEWSIWLAKYETTIGQYAYVIGEGNLKKGLAHYADVSGRGSDYLKKLTAGDKKAKALMAYPADRVPPADIQVFIRKLNMVCYASKACYKALPDVGASSLVKKVKYVPFFRLPTEVEWETAARGFVVNKDGYEDRLPVSAGKIDNYAEMGKVRSIGRKKPIFGFYDLFGNVAELVDGRMGRKIGELGSGSWFAKGGKAGKALAKKPYSSQREEIPEFEWQDGNSSPEPTAFHKVGFRLALGSSLQSFERLAQEEKPSTPTTIDAKPVVTPSSSASTTMVSGSSSIKALDSLLKELGSKSADVSAVQRKLESAVSRLKDEERERNIRLANIVADNTFFKLVRSWSITNQTIKNTELTKKLKKKKSAGTLSKAGAKALATIEKRIKLDAPLQKRLIREYESGLVAIISVPGIDSSIADSIGFESFKQSPNQLVIAKSAVKLLASHITTLLKGASPDVERDVHENFPL